MPKILKSTIRVINYIFLGIIIISLFNEEIQFKLMDIFYATAISLIIIVVGYITVQKSGERTKFMYVISTILLVFTVVLLGQYFPNLKISKPDYDKTQMLHQIFSGWVLILFFIVLVLNVILSDFFHKERNKDID